MTTLLIFVRYILGCLTWQQWFFPLGKQAPWSFWATESQGWVPSRHVERTLPFFHMEVESEGYWSTSKQSPASLSLSSLETEAWSQDEHANALFGRCQPQAAKVRKREVRQGHVEWGITELVTIHQKQQAAPQLYPLAYRVPEDRTQDKNMTE